MKYTVRFFTRDADEYEIANDNLIAEFNSDNPIPVPRVGEIVMLEDDLGAMYEVTGVERTYPYQGSAFKYDFFVDVIVKEVE